MRCGRCRVEKDDAFFMGEGRTCRRCFLHARRRSTLHRLGLEGASDVQLLNAVRDRLAFVEKAVKARTCKLCNAPAVAFFTKLGTEARVTVYAEQLYSTLHIGGVLKKLTALCSKCSLGLWADTPLPEDPAAALAKAKRIAASYRARCMCMPESLRGPMWRAVYYWDRKVKEARRALERAEAEALDALPVPTTPWFGEVDE